MASATTELTARAVEWTPKVLLRDGRTATYIGKCEITGKHRVRTFTYRGKPILPPTDSTQDCVYTTWLLDDQGRRRCDKAESACDYAGAA